jgi:hypothetical protein
MPEDENINLKMNYQVLEQVLARIRCILRVGNISFIYTVFLSDTDLWIWSLLRMGFISSLSRTITGLELNIQAL